MQKYLPSISLASFAIAAAVLVTSAIGFHVSGMTTAISDSSFTVNLPTPPVRTFNIEPALFGAILEDGAASQVSAPPAGAQPPGRLLLMGVIAGGPKPAAMIKNLAGDTVAIFRVGQGVFGQSEFVSRIDPSGVILKGAYGKREIKLGVHPDAQPAIIELKAPPELAGSATGPGRSLSRSEINASVRSAEQILGESNPVPEIRGGKIVGFKVSEVSDNSILKQMGIMKGDIIKTANGQALDSLERGVRIWEQLKRAPEIHMVVERNGQEQVMSYSVRP